jgi:hypothetical protein
MIDECDGESAAAGKKNECGERRRKERRMYPYGGKRSIVYGVVVEWQE